MAIRTVVQAGHPVIRQKAEAVEKMTTKTTKNLVNDLVETMRELGLVGIAAPQIGKAVRIFVTEIRTTKNRKNIEPDPLRIFINPEIIAASKTSEFGWEGCGSVAHSDLFAQVRRPKQVTVQAYDEHGVPFTLTAKGLLARVIQHEYDHLEGVLFVDRADMRTCMSGDEYRQMRQKESRKK